MAIKHLPVSSVLIRKHARQMFAYAYSAIGFFRHIFKSLTRFKVIPNPMRILYKTSFLPES
jgi:hypothetical protein